MVNHAVTDGMASREALKQLLKARAIYQTEVGVFSSEYCPSSGTDATPERQDELITIIHYWQKAYDAALQREGRPVPHRAL
jgi:hypothetical protein